MPIFNDILSLRDRFFTHFPQPKFDWNLSTGSHIETSAWQSDQRTDMTKVIGDFPDYANASNNLS
jgi:hypothetical protein